VELEATRVGRDASRIADEVISHLAGLVGATVKVTLEIDAEIPQGASERVVRTVTENSRTPRFTNQGLEEEQHRSGCLPSWSRDLDPRATGLGGDTGKRLASRSDWRPGRQQATRRDDHVDTDHAAARSGR
jgi:hypothetical protein